jgi:hypothetical protein
MATTPKKDLGSELKATPSAVLIAVLQELAKDATLASTIEKLIVEKKALVKITPSKTSVGARTSTSKTPTPKTTTPKSTKTTPTTTKINTTTSRTTTTPKTTTSPSNSKSSSSPSTQNKASASPVTPRKSLEKKLNQRPTPQHLVEQNIMKGLKKINFQLACFFP